MPLATPPGAAAPLYARNKVTGETYYVGAAPATALDDLTDVDVSTTGPTGGSALIWDETVSQWVPGVASTVASLDDLTDVTTSGGPTGPSGPADGQVLMWDEALGQWVPGPGSAEVEIGPTQPTGPWELWVDEATELPAGGTGGGGGSLDSLTDVDTTTITPADGNSLVWNATAGLWVPFAVTTASTTDYLPLAGGTMDDGAIVNFAEEVGDKIVLFPAASARFGFGVQSGRLEYFVTNVGNKHSFMVGGTERAFIDQNGIGPRTTVNVVWMNSFTGSMDFRVNPSMVTMRMGGVNRNDGIDVGQDLQVCALPAGVPAPWASVATTIASTATGAVANTPVEVEVRSTGVWLKNIGGGYAWGPWKASITWSR